MELEEQLLLASKALQNHGVVAFPTDSVMGLGVIYDDEVAYNRLNEVKRRPSTKLYSMMFAHNEDIDSFAYLSKKARRAINAFLPGPITFLLKAKPCVPGYVTHNTGIIGIRVTPHKTTTRLIELVGKPLLVPSANKSGAAPALNSNEVKKIFGDELDYIVDGEAQIGQASTVVDFTGKEIKVLREGPISLNEILAVVEEK